MDHARSAAAMLSHPLLQRIPHTNVTAFHLRILLISGMGFFTDAYDLFIILKTIPTVLFHKGAF